MWSAGSAHQSTGHRPQRPDLQRDNVILNSSFCHTHSLCDPPATPEDCPHKALLSKQHPAHFRWLTQDQGAQSSTEEPSFCCPSPVLFSVGFSFQVPASSSFWVHSCIVLMVPSCMKCGMSFNALLVSCLLSFCFSILACIYSTLLINRA